MKKILISACLVGDKTNYKGERNYHPLVDQLKLQYDLVLFCPEVEAGLKTPRLPNEIRGNQKKGRKTVKNKFWPTWPEFFAAIFR